MKTIHVIIDPQNDFIDDIKNSPSLAVNGALENMKVLADVLKKDNFNEVLITLDTHAVLDIAHTSWWKDKNGNEISPFTQITSEDILSGNFVAANPEMQEYSLSYTRELENKGKYKHFVWPNHCIEGTKGHEVHEEVQKVLKEKNVKVQYLKKGINPKTEHYSAFKAEVPLDDDEKTQLDMKTINYINQFDKVVFSGEAQSHCVKASVLDFLMNIPDQDRKKVFILEDCMASVPGFENEGKEFIYLAKELGANVMNSNQYLSLEKKSKLKM